MSEPTRDLVQRTFEFALAVRRSVNRLPKSVSNFENARQLVRSSGSVAANYLEAQEGLSRRDFLYRIKVCRKEARETNLWLRLTETGTDELLSKAQTDLSPEATELTKIFSRFAAKDDTGEKQ